MNRSLGLWVVLVLGGAGCSNPCQQICGRMADYAKECGQTVSDTEISSCESRMGSDLDSDTRQACKDFGDPEVIRAQWSCEELASYWTSSS